MQKQVQARLSLLCCAVALILAPAAWGRPLFRLTFDSLPVGAAPATYLGGSDELLPYEWKLTESTYTPTVNTQVIASTGPQGGNALQVSPSSWSETVGYFTTRGPIVTFGLRNNESHGFTLETVIRIDQYQSDANIMGEWGGGLDTSPTLGLRGSGGSPSIEFAPGVGYSPAIMYTPSASLLDGQFHHIAGVWQFGGWLNQSVMRLYVDHVLRAELSYTEEMQAPRWAVQAFGIGNDGRQWGPVAPYATIDAVSGSSDVLNPDTFILQPPYLPVIVPEPATGMLLLIGISTAALRRRTSADQNI